MNRRSFFSAFAGAIATAAAVDPERLLWTPGRKLISIPNTLTWRNGQIYVALFTSEGQEVSGGHYQRVGYIPGQTEIIFPAAAANWGTIEYVAVFDHRGRMVKPPQKLAWLCHVSAHDNLLIHNRGSLDPDV